MVSAGSVMSLKFWLSTEIWIDVGPPRPLANDWRTYRRTR